MKSRTEKEHLHGILKLALIERLDLANGVHGRRGERKLEEKEAGKVEEGPTRSVCGTVNSPIVYSKGPESPLLQPP